MTDPIADHVELNVDGRSATVPAAGTLLDALRERLGVRSAKDGCSPQGQCGCCTVLVDGQPRVACVTPVARVAGRAITTADGLDDAATWADALVAHGGSQCGFCTPGIICRLASVRPTSRTEAGARQALLAHLCRCTGWQPIVEAAVEVWGGSVSSPTRTASWRTGGAGADAGARHRAALEGGVEQAVGPAVALGRGGFADDGAPDDSLVALVGADGEWVVGDDLDHARRLAGKIQGRRSTAPVTWPIELPAGDFVHALQTTWVEPAYLEPDASWCEPGGTPASALGNGGAFGGKRAAAVEAAARELADRHGRPVRAIWSREDVVRLGPKRPPLAAGVTADGRVVVHVAATPGIVEAIRDGSGHRDEAVEVVPIDTVGPPTSTAFRAVGWGEVALLRSALDDRADVEITRADGARAVASFDDPGTLRVRVRAGSPLDDVVLRSYCTGAAHMALGWVRSEALSVDADGVPVDLTIRSFGVLRAVDTPRIVIEVEPGEEPPVAVSECVFVAVAAAAWRAAGHPRRLPVTG